MTQITQPDVTIGLVLKEPGKRAVVSTWAWFRAPSTRDNRPPRESVEAGIKEWLDEWFEKPLDHNPDGRVRSLGDLIGELVGYLPGLPDGAEQGIAFEKYGELFGITDVEFDVHIPGSEEYDEEGSDLVLLKGQGD